MLLLHHYCNIQFLEEMNFDRPTTDIWTDTYLTSIAVTLTMVRFKHPKRRITFLNRKAVKG